MIGRPKVVTRRRMANARTSSTTRGVHPARTVTLAFVVLIAIGTVLLALPPMRQGPGAAPLSVALFTSVSASCVTGLAVVDTGTYWSSAGQVTILALIQVGGFGIMTLATLAVILVSRKVGLQTRLATSTETGTLELGALRTIIKGVAAITALVEISVALILGMRLDLAYDHTPWRALQLGIFHSISAFNNAGFALAPDSLTSYRDDQWIMMPISMAIILGGLGFPVMLELTRRGSAGFLSRHRRRLTPAEVSQRASELAGPGRFNKLSHTIDRQGFRGPVPLSLHTRLMLTGTLVMIVVGSLGFAYFEWTNPATLGPENFWQSVTQSFFSGGVTPRTAGFNIVDYSLVRPETRFLTDLLMFIGGGSASTAGGIKVTTMMVLLLAAVTEVRGHRDVNALDRRIPASTVRIGLAVVMVLGAIVMVGTLALLSMTKLDLDRALFEVISAAATVGLSANVTPTLPEPAQLLLVFLMLLGRVGPVTLVSALSLRTSERRYRLPEGRPLIG